MKIKHRKPLTKDDFGLLKRGHFYGLFLEPGAGKTHTMKTGLVQHCEENNKTMLILTHRDSLKLQTKADLDEAIKKWEAQFRGNGIVVMNYQAIEYAYKTDKYFKIEHLFDFDFVVCDEAHYMVKDAWNEQTDYTEQFLNDFQGVKILMTGTPKEIRVLCQRWNVEQLTKINRENNNLKAIRIYETNTDLIEHINQYANENCKVLSFISGKTERVLALKNEHGGSFIVSKHNDLYDNADKELMNIVINGDNAETNGILPTYKLWSTSVWNEGINIIDSQLNAVCSFQPRSSTEFIQQFARARRSDIVGCIVAPTRKMLVGHKQKCQAKLDEIYTIREEKDNPNFASMSELYYLESIRETEEILEYGFGAYVASVYKTIPVYDYGQIIRDQKLAEYLNTLVDVKMFDAEQKQFGQTMIEQFGYRDSNRKKIFGPKAFNQYLESIGIEYELDNTKKERSKKSEHVGKVYWMLKKRTQNDAVAIYGNCVKTSTLSVDENATNLVTPVNDDFEQQLNAFKFKPVDEITTADATNLLTKMLMKKRLGV